MRSAALLPTPGDPFVVAHWLDNYRKVWRGEVDELRVQVNRQPDVVARAYLMGLVEDCGGIYSEVASHGSHGAALDVLVRETSADLVVLMEDDALVRIPGSVAQKLQGIKDQICDVASSPRGGMSPELEDAAFARWGDCTAPADGTTGAGMWPAFAFARRECLLETEGTFGARSWRRGELVSGLDHRVEADVVAADTLCGTAFQLRRRFRVANLPQWKLPWGWEEHLASGMPVRWFHIGSLSSVDLLNGPVPKLELPSIAETSEWTHRLCWWRRCLRRHGDELPRHAARYWRNWLDLLSAVGARVEDVDAWEPLIERMVTW